MVVHAVSSIHTLIIISTTPAHIYHILSLLINNTLDIVGVAGTNCGITHHALELILIIIPFGHITTAPRSIVLITLL